MDVGAHKCDVCSLNHGCDAGQQRCHGSVGATTTNNDRDVCVVLANSVGATTTNNDRDVCVVLANSVGATTTNNDRDVCVVLANSVGATTTNNDRDVCVALRRATTNNSRVCAAPRLRACMVQVQHEPEYNYHAVQHVGDA
jgi:hypothetical protein